MSHPLDFSIARIVCGDDPNYRTPDAFKSALPSVPIKVEGMDCYPSIPCRTLVFDGAAPPNDAEVIDALRRKYTYTLPHIELVRQSMRDSDFLLQETPRKVIPNFIWTIGNDVLRIVWGCDEGADVKHISISSHKSKKSHDLVYGSVLIAALLANNTDASRALPYWTANNMQIKITSREVKTIRHNTALDAAFLVHGTAWSGAQSQVHLLELMAQMPTRTQIQPFSKITTEQYIRIGTHTSARMLMNATPLMISMLKPKTHPLKNYDKLNGYDWYDIGPVRMCTDLGLAYDMKKRRLFNHELMLTQAETDVVIDRLDVLDGRRSQHNYTGSIAQFFRSAKNVLDESIWSRLCKDMCQNESPRLPIRTYSM